MTPIMHDFWTLPDDSAERYNDMVNFFKVWCVGCSRCVVVVVMLLLL